MIVFIYITCGLALFCLGAMFGAIRAVRADKARDRECSNLRKAIGPLADVRVPTQMLRHGPDYLVSARIKIADVLTARELLKRPMFDHSPMTQIKERLTRGPH